MLHRLRRATGLPKQFPRMSTRIPFLITGGLGGLGLRAGSVIIGSGSAVLLTSRSGRVPREGQGLDRLLKTLDAKGACTLMCDVQEGTHVQAGFLAWRARGVLHAAGISTTDSLIRVSLNAHATAYAPKALGASHIHHATAACH